MDSPEAAGHSERKVQALALLRAHGPMTVAEVADAAGVTKTNMENVLARCRRSGYVESEGGEFRPGKGQQPAQYDVTSRGVERLQYERR